MFSNHFVYFNHLVYFNHFVYFYHLVNFIILFTLYQLFSFCQAKDSIDVLIAVTCFSISTNTKNTTNKGSIVSAAIYYSFLVFCIFSIFFEYSYLLFLFGCFNKRFHLRKQQGIFQETLDFIQCFLRRIKRCYRVIRCMVKLKVYSSMSW